MAFQLNEKMMAPDRAIITRNKTEQDLLRTDVLKFKPGMAHYVSDNQKLWLSIEPKKMPDNSIKTFLEIITDTRLEHIMLDYVNRDGGANNSMRGSLHSIVPTGISPFVVESTTKVTNLNVDRVDDMHVDINAVNSTIVGRDSGGNININNNVYFNSNKIEDSSSGIAIKKKDGSGLTNLTAATLSSSTGIIKATGSTNIGAIEWKNNVWNVGVEGKTSEIVTKSLYGHGKGIDADTVDGKHVDDTQISTGHLWSSKKINDSKAPRGYGLGTDINVIPNNDCNTVTGTGFFSGTNPANGVNGEFGEAILQTYISAKGQVQKIKYLDSNNSYERIKNGSTWSSWDLVISKSNILDKGINIILSSTQPTNISNENTYWYEII